MAKITLAALVSHPAILRDKLSLVCLLCSILFFACKRETSVSGVWREVPNVLNEQQDQNNSNNQLNTDSSTAETTVLYELNLGQYGDRVAGVSVRYQTPRSESLAFFDQADRCDCSFVVQGLIEELENPQDDRLLFVANGLTFSLYPPQQTTNNNSRCPTTSEECKRIFDLEQTEQGAALEGQTWCLDKPDQTRRFIRFESITGITEA